MLQVIPTGLLMCSANPNDAVKHEEVQHPQQRQQEREGHEQDAPPSEPIPSHYVSEKLTQLGHQYFGDTGSSDCIIRLVAPRDDDETVEQTSSPTRNRHLPSRYVVIGEYPAHTPFLSARSPRLRALIAACNAASASASASSSSSSLPSQQPASTPRQQRRASVAPYRIPSTHKRRKPHLPLHPPSPETFAAVMRWMYTSDAAWMEDYIQKCGGREVAEGVFANACWLGLEGGNLLRVCEKFLEADEDSDEGEEDEV
ncbi:hypothetical protein HK104_007342 [Borealophlyctis nickersoniae]|nr:hypothetical protein HK104_007342 [Borealophlyctis nickersoniae]